MKQADTLEKIPFEDTTNIIDMEHFPETFPLHWHQYVEILCLPEHADCLQPACVKIEGKEYRLVPGDLLLIWPGELHEVAQNQDKQIIGLQFASSLFNELPELGAYLNAFRRHHLISYATQTELAQNMITHIFHMLALKKERGAFCNVQTRIALYELFMVFGTYILQNEQELPRGLTDTTEKMNAACNYIIEHCDQPLTLNSVADHMGFSPYYFSRTFKKTTNYSFVEYLTYQRLKRAQTLLADATLSITEVCYRSGFKSISTFNRVFQLYKGCSPSNYRKYYTKE